MEHSGRLILAERLAGWLRAQGSRSSARALSIQADLAENAVSRILEHPERSTQRTTWEKLARTLGWDVAEVLSLAGYGQAREPLGDNPDLLLERAMAIWGLDGETRDHLRRQIALLRRLGPAPTPAPRSRDGGPPPSAGRKPRSSNSTPREPVALQ